MHTDRFRFKQFNVSHSKSSMKVGVDAVLLGAWASLPPGGKNILDVGTGCGVISLMLAQRFPFSSILGLDIDQASVEEAVLNFKSSPWGDRLSAKRIIFPGELDLNRKFDLIVSNPPYFDSGIHNPVTPREIARHTGSLSVFSLLQDSAALLTDGGRLAVIFPTEFFSKVEKQVLSSEFQISRATFVRNNPHTFEKRIMVEFCKDLKPENNLKGSSGSDSFLMPEWYCRPEISHLVLFQEGEPTADYINLCRDFYLKF